MLKRFGLMSALSVGLAATLAMGGCATTTDLSQPLSVPDNGTRLDASSGADFAQSMDRMLVRLNPKERGRVANALFSVAGMSACLEQGFFSPFEQRGRSWFDGSRPKPRSNDKCLRNIKDMHKHANVAANAYTKRRRPDHDVNTQFRGPFNVTHRGVSDFDSWERFLNWGGKSLDGMTRTEIVNRYQAIVAAG